MRSLLVLTAAIATLAPRVAWADDRCPGRDAVAAHLFDPASRDADFRVEDQGDSFVVSCAGERRVFVDPARDCASRAKVAAVAVTAIVAPPSAMAEPAAAPVAPVAPIDEAPRPPPAAPARTPETLPPFRVGIGVLMEISPASSDHGTVAAPGLAARVAWIPARLGVGLGLSLLAPTTFDAGPKEVRLTRAVADLSVHYVVPLGASLRLVPALGPALEIHDIRGTAADGAGELRALFAVRAGLELALALSQRLAVAVESSALVLPVTADLALHETGVVGKEPSFYASLGAGLRLRL